MRLLTSVFLQQKYLQWLGGGHLEIVHVVKGHHTHKLKMSLTALPSVSSSRRGEVDTLDENSIILITLQLAYEPFVKLCFEWGGALGTKITFFSSS